MLVLVCRTIAVNFNNGTMVNIGEVCIHAPTHQGEVQDKTDLMLQVDGNEKVTSPS